MGESRKSKKSASAPSLAGTKAKKARKKKKKNKQEPAKQKTPPLSPTERALSSSSRGSRKHAAARRGEPELRRPFSLIFGGKRGKRERDEEAERFFLSLPLCFSFDNERERENARSTPLEEEEHDGRENITRCCSAGNAHPGERRTRGNRGARSAPSLSLSFCSPFFLFFLSPFKNTTTQAPPPPPASNGYGGGGGGYGGGGRGGFGGGGGYGGGSDRYGGGGGHPGSFGGDRYGANANGGAAPGGPAPAATGRDAPPHAFGSTDGFSLSAEEYRKKHELTVVSRGGQVPDPLQSFDSVGFSPEIMREIQRAGYAAPTPIQAQSWAVALRGSDLISIAKTGSGKTCGFLLPGFMHCAATRRDPRVGPTMTVLAPTRELAVQIKEEADKFGRSGGFRNTCCYGR